MAFDWYDEAVRLREEIRDLKADLKKQRELTTALCFALRREGVPGPLSQEALDEATTYAEAQLRAALARQASDA